MAQGPCDNCDIFTLPAASSSSKADPNANIAAISKAVDAINKSGVGSFLQAPASQILKRAVSNGDMPEADQEEVPAFLSQGANYAPQSGKLF